MFTADATIDAVQTAKKTFVNTFVTNESIKGPMIEFIDAQSEYTKKAAKVTLDTAAKLANETFKVMQEASKIDYTKFYDNLNQAFGKAKK